MPATGTLVVLGALGCGRIDYQHLDRATSESASTLEANSEGLPALAPAGDLQDGGGDIANPNPSPQAPIAAVNFDNRSDYLAGIPADFNATIQGTIQSRTGVGGSGSAIAFGLNSYIEIPHHAELEETLSVDMWVKLSPFGTFIDQAIFSKDAFGPGLGSHFTLAVVRGNQLALRLQVPSGSSEEDTVLCSSDDLETNRWYHVVANLGPPVIELYIDGASTVGEGQIQENDLVVGIRFSCGTLNTAHDLTRNTESWLFGASNVSSTAGTTNRIKNYFRGEIDNLQIKRERTTF